MNSLASIPPLFATAAAFAVFATAILMVALHVLMLARAGERAGLSDLMRSRVAGVGAVFFAGWLGLALVLANGAYFPLPSEAWRGPLSALVALAPFSAALVLLWRSRPLRAINAATPVEWLIGIQVYRVLGGIFIFPFSHYGVLPAGFAWPAGVGDFLTGAFAPLVAWAVARRRPGAFGWAVAWNVFGFLDLIVAPATAILTRASVLTLYPLAIVPLFLGPPLGILTHILSLRNLFAAKRAGAFGHSLRPGQVATA